MVLKSNLLGCQHIDVWLSIYMQILADIDARHNSFRFLKGAPRFGLWFWSFYDLAPKTKPASASYSLALHVHRSNRHREVRMRSSPDFYWPMPGDLPVQTTIIIVH